MKTKTGLLALGLFTFVATSIVNCGGSSDDGNGSTGTAGKGGSSSTAGSSGKAGSTSTTAGTSSGGADDSGTAGTATTGGSSATAGTGGNATAGRPGVGGDNGFPGFGGDNGFPGFGGDNGFPGAGGANNFGPADCPAGTIDGGMCTRAMGQASNSCTLADGSFCTCQRAQGNAMSTYRCRTLTLPGAGGDNGGFGAATCPAAAKTGDDCTDGPGACTGQNRCFCNQQNKITCF